MQVWLQDFAWSEASKPAKLAQRADHAVGLHERQLLSDSPIFCFETALIAHRAPQVGFACCCCWTPMCLPVKLPLSND